MLDGRDIGTEVCPDANVKIFVTASPEVRARRWFLELSEAGADATYEGVLQDVIARDKRDAERVTSPMVQAGDAVLIDTSDLSIEQAVARAVAVVEERRAAG